MNRNKSAEEIKLFDLTKEPRESDENYWPNLSSTTWAVIPLPDGVPAYWTEELPVESTKEMKLIVQPKCYHLSGPIKY